MFGKKVLPLLMSLTLLLPLFLFSSAVPSQAYQYQWPYTLQVGASPANSVTVGQTVTLTATLTDANGNPVQYATIKCTNSTGSISNYLQSTNAAGQTGETAEYNFPATVTYTFQVVSVPGIISGSLPSANLTIQWVSQQVPAAPTGLTLSNISSNSVTLTWNPVSNSTYRLYEKVWNSSSSTWGTANLIATTSDTSYTLNYLTTGEILQFYVTAVNSYGEESSASNTVQVTIPGTNSNNTSTTQTVPALTYPSSISVVNKYYQWQYNGITYYWQVQIPENLINNDNDIDNVLNNYYNGSWYNQGRMLSSLPVYQRKLVLSILHNKFKNDGLWGAGSPDYEFTGRVARLLLQQANIDGYNYWQTIEFIQSFVENAIPATTTGTGINYVPELPAQTMANGGSAIDKDILLIDILSHLGNGMPPGYLTQLDGMAQFAAGYDLGKWHFPHGKWKF